MFTSELNELIFEIGYDQCLLAFAQMRTILRVAVFNYRAGALMTTPVMASIICQRMKIIAVVKVACGVLTATTGS